MSSGLDSTHEQRRSKNKNRQEQTGEADKNKATIEKKPEFSNGRKEAQLRRVAFASGGRYVESDEAAHRPT